MTDSATAQLSYHLASTPATLNRATSGRPCRGRLEITATRNPAARGAATCRSITVTVPTGTGPRALTNQPERIHTAYSAHSAGHGRTWYIHKNTTDPERTVFTLTPENPRHEAVFDDTATLTLILNNIPLTGQSDTVALNISDQTGTGTGTCTRSDVTLTLTIHPAPRPGRLTRSAVPVPGTPTQPGGQP
jgi:hypothetical protein